MKTLFTVLVFLFSLNLDAQIHPDIPQSQFNWYMWVSSPDTITAIQTPCTISMQPVDTDSVEICVNGAGFNFCDVAYNEPEVLQQTQQTFVLQYNFTWSGIVIYTACGKDTPCRVPRVSYEAPNGTVGHFYKNDFFFHMKSYYESKGYTFVVKKTKSL